MQTDNMAPLGGITYARFFPSDWRSGCFTLNLEEEGLYIRSCAWMYDTGQPIPGNDLTAAKLLNVQVQKYSKVMASLIDKGKMIRAQGTIMNKRVFDEIDKYRLQQEARSAAAKRREEDRKAKLAAAATQVILDTRSGLTQTATPPPTPPPTWGGLPGGYPLPTPPRSSEGEPKKLNEINGCSTQSCHNPSTTVADAGFSQNPYREESKKEGENTAQQNPDSRAPELAPRSAAVRCEENRSTWKFTAAEYRALLDRLMDAAAGAMVPLAAAPGLENLSVPINWLEHGADLDRDILPAIAEAARRRKLRGEQIGSWLFFEKPVATAKARREAGLPPVAVPRGPQAERRRPTRSDIAAAVEELEGRRNGIIDVPFERINK